MGLRSAHFVYLKAVQEAYVNEGRWLLSFYQVKCHTVKTHVMHTGVVYLLEKGNMIYMLHEPCHRIT
jgi:hypothetical protein